MGELLRVFINGPKAEKMRNQMEKIHPAKDSQKRRKLIQKQRWRFVRGAQTKYVYGA